VGSNGYSRFAVVPSSSRIDLESRTSLHRIVGKGTGLTGYIDAAWQDNTLLLDPPPQIHIEVPVDRLNSGSAAQDTEMKKFIGSRAHPIIVAELRKVEPTEQKEKYLVKGAITVRGATAEHDGTIAVHRAGNRLNVDGSEMIYIRKFGLEPPKMLMFQVNAYVRVSLHLVAELEE
jgi:polyisoprenoid-binding protein YceI